MAVAVEETLLQPRLLLARLVRFRLVLIQLLLVAAVATRAALRPLALAAGQCPGRRACCTRPRTRRRKRCAAPGWQRRGRRRPRSSKRRCVSLSLSHTQHFQSALPGSRFPSAGEREGRALLTLSRKHTQCPPSRRAPALPKVLNGVRPRNPSPTALTQKLPRISACPTTTRTPTRLVYTGLRGR